jgi:hypothetical protein
MTTVATGSIDAMAKSFGDRNFQLLPVSVDTDWKVVKEFARQHEVGLPVFLDPGRQVADL